MKPTRIRAKRQYSSKVESFYVADAMDEWLRETVLRWVIAGIHDYNCAKMQNGAFECDCGRDALIAELSDAE